MFEIDVGNLTIFLSSKEAVARIEEVSKAGEIAPYLARLVEQDVSGKDLDSKLDRLVSMIELLSGSAGVLSASAGPSVLSEVVSEAIDVVESVKPKGSAMDVLRRMKEINKKGGA